MRRIAVTAIVATAGLVAGCGGTPGPDLSSPQDVAQAYVAAHFRCGEDGAGRVYDLSWSPERDWTRSTYLTLQARAGCAPRPIPDLHPVVVTTGTPNCPYATAGDDLAAVVVYTGDPHAAHTQPVGLTLESIDGSWKVNTMCSADPTGLVPS
jgi:hypothetical protein